MGNASRGRSVVVALAMAILALGGCDAPEPTGSRDTDTVAHAAQAEEPAGDGSLRAADTRRFALVFGNGAYRYGDALAAPAHDATLMAEALRARGYHVLVRTDRTLAQMREDLATFEAVSDGGDLRVLYFAGHGFEFDNANYLMPVDLPRSVGELGEQDVRTHALRLDRVMWELEQDVPVLVTVVDACRVPPSRGTAALPGLKAEAPPEGSIVAYATSPGRLAMDSLRAYGIDEVHSPYTYFLVDALRSPEVDTWDQAFRVAYSVVNDRTRGAQQPWMNARVNAFPTVGRLQQASGSGLAASLGLGLSPERRAAGRYWAEEASAAGMLERDRTWTDAELQAAGERGDARATLALASRWSGRPGDTARVVALLRPLAEAGNAVAQVDLGTVLYAEAAEDPDGHDARHWWELASQQGMGEARAKLAVLDGHGPDAARELMHGFMEQHEAFAPGTETKR